MAEKVWTAVKLESLTPEEHDAIFESSLVRDPADVSLLSSWSEFASAVADGSLLHDLDRQLRPERGPDLSSSALLARW